MKIIRKCSDFNHAGVGDGIIISKGKLKYSETNLHFPRRWCLGMLSGRADYPSEWG
jgi:hypothetical protein